MGSQAPRPVTLRQSLRPVIAGSTVLPADEAAGGAPVEGVPTSFAAGVTLEASVAAATIRGMGSAGLALASESRPTACE